MIFLFLLPMYLAAVVYMILRFLYWVKNCHHVFDWKPFKYPLAVWFAVSSVTPLIAVVLPKNTVTIVIRRYSTYWIGILLYLLTGIITRRFGTVNEHYIEEKNGDIVRE